MTQQVKTVFAKKAMGRLATAALVLLSLLLWEVTVGWFKIAPYILPPPTNILIKMNGSWAVLISKTGVTLLESVVGLLIALAVGIAGALLFQLYPSVGA